MRGASFLTSIGAAVTALLSRSATIRSSDTVMPAVGKSFSNVFAAAFSCSSFSEGKRTSPIEIVLITTVRVSLSATDFADRDATPSAFGTSGDVSEKATRALSSR